MYSPQEALRGAVPPGRGVSAYMCRSIVATALLFAAATAKAALRAALYRTISAHRVGQRPDRVEPRAVKRRPKPHALLTIPRRQARKCVRQGQYA